MNKYRRDVALAAVSALALGITTIAALPVANATTLEDGPGYTVEPIGPPREAGYTVENYLHPGADMLAAQTGIILKTGDGYLMHTTCGSDPNQISIRSTNFDQRICFKAAASKGWLTMEIPGSFLVRASNDKDLSVTSTLEGNTRVDLVPKGGNVDVRSDSEDVTIVELRIK